jgi:dGTPase
MTLNKFYNSYDFQRLKESERNEDYRTPFQIDRDRIIHSSEFRRLQGKTQVFLPGEYDFYRTRLTHSIEVAQIGRSICNYLIKKENTFFGEDYYPDSDLVEAACLSHDLGHPPFGHAGERTLNRLMKETGGFEGNAQTLRLITEIFYKDKSSRRGMNPTRAFLDSILKYKCLYTDSGKPENHFIYDAQKSYIDFVFDGKNIPGELLKNDNLNSFQSFECQIMDWADDTAYAINDLVDSISGGFLSIQKLENFGKDNSSFFTGQQIKYLDEIIESIKNGKYKSRFGSEIGEFISACSIKKRSTFMDELTNRYKYQLVINSEILDKARLYKQISVQLVFRSHQIHQMEFKGDLMIEKVFEVFRENYVELKNNKRLLPDFSDNLIKQADGELLRTRLICDQLAGMTDSYAMRTYRRLFEPDFGSIIEIA